MASVLAEPPLSRSPLTPHKPSADINLNTQRVVWLRAIAMPAPAALLVLASLFYDFTLPVTPLLIIIGILVLVNAWTWRRLQSSQPLSDREFFVQMLVDTAALTATLYFSGGSLNPFAWFFMLPLMITATVLPRIYVWTIAALSIASYTMLMFFRLPMPAFLSENEDFLYLHSIGMWMGFVLIAVLVAHFVAGMGVTLRERERRLAEARERALQDERVLSLATLAAGAAHEISTPLNTMDLLAEEIEAELPADRYQEVRNHLATLHGQIERCKDALSVLSASAGAERGDDARAERPGQMLTRIVRQVRSLRPGTQVSLDLPEDGPGALIVIERTMDQALINLIDNAVDVSPRSVDVRGRWNDADLTIEILDRGPGPEHIGDQSSGGLGVGLFITRAIVGQLGGTVKFQARNAGGTRTTIVLPLAGLLAGA